MWLCCMFSHIQHTLTQKAFISSSVFKCNTETSYDYGFFSLASGSTHFEQLDLSDNSLFGSLPASETQSSQCNGHPFFIFPSFELSLCSPDSQVACAG